MRALSACVVLLALASLAGSVDSAQACSCAAPDPWTNLRDADGAFVGRLVSREDAAGSKAVFTFSVERAVKGAIGDSVKVRSESSGASCGIEATVGQRVGLFLRLDGKTWVGDLCHQVQPEDLLAAASPLPAPNGRGAAAMYVGGRFGPARTIALDARGHTLAYGLGTGSTALLSLCPGGKRLAEIAQQRTGSELAIRDTRTLRVIRRRALELPGQRYATGLQCESAWGSAVVVFGNGPGDAAHGAGLFRLAGGRLRAVWTGSAYLSSLTPRFAYLNAGSEAARLVRVDVRNGRSTPIVWLPLSPRVVPDPTGRRLAGVAFRIRGYARLILVDLAGKAVVVRSIPLEGSMITGDVHWLPGERLLFLPTIDREQGRVLDRRLRTMSRFEWTGRTDTARVGSAAWGLDWQGRLVSAPLPGGPERVVRRLPGGGRGQVMISATS